MDNENNSPAASLGPSSSYSHPDISTMLFTGYRYPHSKYPSSSLFELDPHHIILTFVVSNHTNKINLSIIPYLCASRTLSISSGLPIKIPDRSWMLVGLTSSILSIFELTAFPPAFSMTIAMGAHSYKILSLPLGLFLSAGYAKIPPYRSVRYASATIDPMYRAE